jgi:hypothetical protein
MKMAEIGIACHDIARNKLPAATFDSPNGLPLSSWRFQVIPYIGFNEGAAYRDAWNSTANQHVWQSWATDWFTVWPSHTDTKLFGICGPGTAFEGMRRYDRLPQDLILVIEVANSKTHWMQPGDYNVTDLLSYTGRIGDHLHGLLDDRLHVLFADGEVWALSSDAPITALHPFLTITGAEANDRYKLLAPHRVE